MISEGEKLPSANKCKKTKDNHESKVCPECGKVFL